MKKLGIILLIGIYLSSATEAHDLLKLSNLVVHFFEHKELDQSINLSGYIALHYGDRAEDHHSQDTDHDLPFQSQNHQHSFWNSGIVAVMPVSDQFFWPSEVAIATKTKGHPCGVLSQGMPDLLFQPPRLI